MVRRMLPALVACLFGLSAAPDTLCADSDDDFFISLPTEKPGKNQTSASSNKTDMPVGIRPEDKLPGVIYDLTRTSSRKQTNFMERRTPDSTDLDFNVVPFLKEFVLGSWSHKSDAKGNLIYNGLNHLRRSSKTPYRSYYYQETVPPESVMSSFYEEVDDVSNAGWCSVHSGFVVAPFTGRFRFVGFGNDILVVRFNREIVFDYGWYALTLGTLIKPDEFRAYPGGKQKPQTDQTKHLLQDHSGFGLYSSKLDTYYSSKIGNRGVAKGLPISVTKGRAYPIEILYSNFRGEASVVLFIERLDSGDKPLKANPAKLPLFRTTAELPPHPSSDSFPDFDDDSPIWKVSDYYGKALPSRTPAASQTKKNASASGTKKTDSAASESSQKQQAGAQQENDPKPKKTVKTTKNGNVTTETVVEQIGDTTIETVTTTEIKDDTEFQTTVTTEKKNGVVVKESTSKRTSTTTTKVQTSETNPSSSGGTAPSPSSETKKTDPSSRNIKKTPFGYSRPVEEDDED